MSRAEYISRLGNESNIFVGTNNNIGIGSTIPNSKLGILGNLNVTGVVTANSFVGNVTGTATTATTALGLSGTPNITVGVVTATSAVVGSGVTINSSGLNVTGVVTATSFVGSGTSLTSINASNISSGIVSTSQLASGTANNTTYLRGDQTWSSLPSGGFSNMQVFTSPGTFTVPPTTTKVKVTVTGGGGGGGLLAPATYYAGTGGGTGIAVINISGPASIPVTIGAAGANFPSPLGSSGGSSSFGTYVSASGGLLAGISPTATDGGSASFPQPAPTYQSTLNIFGGSISSFWSPQPYGNAQMSVGGSSYWGSSGTTSSYGSGSSSRSGVPNGTYFWYPAGAGVVVVEW